MNTTASTATFNRIADYIAIDFSLSPRVLVQNRRRNRSQTVLRARQWAIWFCQMLTIDGSPRLIAAHFGATEATVKMAIKQISARCKVEPAAREREKRLHRELTSVLITAASRNPVAVMEALAGASTNDPKQHEDFSGTPSVSDFSENQEPPLHVAPTASGSSPRLRASVVKNPTSAEK